MGLRDIALLGLILGLALYALRYPWVGAMLWTWVSLMNPHQQFSWSLHSYPVAQIAAVATLLGLLFTRERRNPFDRPATVVLLVLLLWCCITLPFSFYLTQSLTLWDRSMKIWLMIFVTIALVDTKQKLDIFIWTCTLSIGFYGLKGGVFTILNGGSYRVWGPGGFIGGNNEIALAMLMVAPLFFYLSTLVSHKLIKLGLLTAMALCAIAALGSHSRGAFLAFFAMAGFLWLKMPKKLVTGPLLFLVSAAILASMPEHWWARMQSIDNYQEDGSALGRINAWWFAWNLARDNFFGGGFSIYYADLFARYSPFPERIHAAHSIYFQVLGEHGFIGLGLFLLVGVLTWIEARKLIFMARGRPDLAWCAPLGRMIHVSMVAYASGGAFLSLAYFDLPYNVMVMAVCGVYVARRVAAKAAAAPESTRTAPAYGAAGRGRTPAPR